MGNTGSKGGARLSLTYAAHLLRRADVESDDEELAHEGGEQAHRARHHHLRREE